MDLNVNENIDPNDGSESSQMGDNAIFEMVEETIPEATKRSTAWGMSVFSKWLTKRQITIDFHDISAIELAGHLKKFYAEVKKVNGELYTPSALTGIRAAIHRAITSPPFMRNLNILDGQDFMAANKVFLAKCRIYVARGNPKPTHKQPISEVDMKKLGKYFSNHRSEVGKLLEASVDTIITYHPETFGEQVKIVKHKKMDYKDFNYFRVLQHWYFDKSTNTLASKVISIGPLQDVLDENGNLKFRRALYYIPSAQ